jgi:hypothetical protein
MSSLINFYGKKCSVLHWCTLHFRECDRTFKQALTAPCSQDLIAGLYPEPNESSSHTHPFFVEDPILILGPAVWEHDGYFRKVTMLWP